MYIKKIELENIKAFKKFTFDLGTTNPAGWHVLLGDNGSGKSTFIRAAAVALMGTNDALKSRHDFSRWVSSHKESGFIRMEIISDKQLDNWALKGKQTIENLNFSIKISQDGILSSNARITPNRHIWSGKKGWFSASYGPFRRFSGGSSEYQKLFYSSPLLARHLTIFGEDVALTETLEWLKDLRFKELENPKSIEAKLLAKIKEFINQKDFLTNGVKFESVSSSEVIFLDANKNKVSIESLSDGYRSVLSMTLELIRQLVSAYDTAEIFSVDKIYVDYPGVVFIDEIDVHLHPIWQRKIGKWLTTHFPKIQFIVSTHSPLICQSAVSGSIWKLPDLINSEEGHQVVGIQFERLVYGNILEALSSDAFGVSIERSEEAQDLLSRLAELNIRDQFGRNLSEKENDERQHLQSIFGLSPNIEPNGNAHD